MSRRILILLAAVVLVWAGVYMLSQRQGKPELTADLWPQIPWESLTRLDVSYASQNYALLRRDEGWRVRLQGRSVAPRVQQAKVEGLAEFLRRHKPRRDLGEINDADARTYGLKPPEAVLGVESGQEVVIELGGFNPSQDGVYAACTLAPSRLLLLDAEYLEQVKKPASHYFDLRLIRAGEQEVESFALSRGGEVMWRIQRENGGYRFLLPERLKQFPAAESEARFYLHNLLTMDAGELQLEQGNQSLSPLFSVGVELKGGRKAEVNVFREKAVSGQMVRRLANSTWQPGLFLLSAERVAQLNRTAFDMRQRTIVSVTTAKVTEFTIVHSDQALGAFKNATGWHSRQTKKELLGIDMSLWRLTDLQFEAEPVQQLPATAQTTMTWTLKNSQGEKAARLVFYSDPELPKGRCWLYVDGKNKYYLVSNQLLKDLQGQLP